MRNGTEVKRLETLERKRRRVAKKIKGNSSQKWLPGEVEHKKKLAAVLRLAGYSQEEIAASIGVSQPVVSRWLAEPEVRELYLYLHEHLTEGALILLRNLTVKAIARLSQILDEEEDNKIVLDAVKEILDRGGLPKESRKQSETHTVEEQRTTFGAIPEVALLRELPLEQQEEAAQIIERLEELLNRGEAATS